MTVTTSPQGAPAPRRAALVPAILALLLSIVSVVGGAPSARAASTPSPTPVSTAAAGEATLTLAPLNGGVVVTGSSLSAWLTLDNGTTQDLPANTATVSLGTQALSGRAALTGWLDGTASAAGLVEVATPALKAVPAGESGSPTLVVVDADDPHLSLLSAGVYPLEVSTATASGTVTARTAITVVDPSAAGAHVAVVVPITAGPISTGLLTSTQLADLTASDGSLTRQLDAVEGTSAILAVDPAIVAAIRVLGTSAPTSAVEWLDRLMAEPNDRFALQFGDADIAAQLGAGAAAPLQPTSLSRYLSASDFPASSDATPTPTPSPTATGTSPFPDLSQLLDVGAGDAPVYWPFSGTVGASDVEALATASGASGLTLVSSASTEAGADGSAVVANARSGDASVLVYDQAVSTALAAAADDPEATTRGAALAAASAYLAFATASAGDSAVLVTVDRPSDVSTVGLSSAVRTVLAGADPVPTLAELTTGSASAVEIARTDADDARTAAAADFLQGEQRIAAFSTILDDPTLLTGAERAEVLQLLGSGWLPDETGWSAAVTAHQEATAKTLDAVGILPPSDVLLVSADGPLRFWVRNDLPWPVNLTLTARSDSLRLEVQAATDVSGATPASNTRVAVPVHAVGSGKATVTLQLQSPTGVAVGGSQAFDVVVQAEWEGVGTAVLTGLIGVLLVLGIVRTILHRRAARRTADGQDAGDDADHAEDDE